MFTTRFNFSKLSFLWILLVLLTMFSCQESVMTDLNDLEETPDIQEDENIIADHYIVQFKEDYIQPSKARNQAFANRAAKQAFSEERAQLTTRKIKSFLEKSAVKQTAVKHYYTAAVAGFAAVMTPAQVELLKNDPQVKSVEQDRLVSINLPEVREDHNSPNGSRSQYMPCGVNTSDTKDGTGFDTWIWIVDTGIDLTHPDLNVQASAPFAATFVGGTPADANGHGTHVAGTAAAIDNNIGVVGTSAGATVVPVRVFNLGGSPISTVIAGLDHVALYDIPGDVVNLSLEGYFGNGCGTNTAYFNSIMNLTNNGTFVAIAAGNGATDANLIEPACLNGHNIFTVAAMTCSQNFEAWYSNYGVGPVDYIAVGTDVYSTWINNSYGYSTGTSMATPIVSGILHASQTIPNAYSAVYHSPDWYPIASF